VEVNERIYTLVSHFDKMIDDHTEEYHDPGSFTSSDTVRGKYGGN